MSDVLGALKRIGLSETYIDPVDKIIKVSDGFPITPSFGVVWYRSLDLGFPNVRESVQDNPQADGTIDETQYTGARNVTLEGTIIGDAFGDIPSINGWPTDIQWNSASWFVSLLSAWANPARRYRLYFEDDIGRSRFMDVRGAGFTCPIEKFSDSRREFQLQMVNPSGKVYSFAEGDNATLDGRYKVQVTMIAAAEDGRTYPLGGNPYQRVYPDSVLGDEDIRYGGTVPNGVLVQIGTGTSTMKAPRVRFTSPLGVVSEVGLDATLSIPANATLSIDTLRRTVSYRLNAPGSPEVNVAQYLRAPLQWPQLRPGINYTAAEGKARTRGYNKVEFRTGPGGTFNSSATMFVIYHEADLL